MGSISHGSHLHRRCRRRRRGPQRWPRPLLRRPAGDGFLGALRRAASLRKVRLTSTTITAEITLTHGDDDQFSLSAVLRPVLGGVDRATAQELAEAAHQICPYSKATRDNVPVVIAADAA
ncbi:hypothetical protein [Streptomyces sp. NRRL F-5727]|uniref:hypothetical protein n=1 Tax=Streptomyces sp. NRRL F-5727 TaxID=1463871 RepID=UPI000A757F9C